MRSLYIPVILAFVLSACAGDFDAPYLYKEMPAWEQDANAWVLEHVIDPAIGFIGGP